MSKLQRRSYVTSAAASGWTGGEVPIGVGVFELQTVEISVPSTVDYALPCYLEFAYHEGEQDEDKYQLGHGVVQYRKPFVIQGPFLFEGFGKIMSAVYHHSTSHTHTVKVTYRKLSELELLEK